MHLALPRQKTLVDQVRPALAAVAVALVGIIFIPVAYPVRVSNGSITPDVARPGDKVDVQWLQDWRELCSITITREFIGSDGFRKTAAPYEYAAPKEKGPIPYSGPMVIPELPVGDAYYHSVIQPHCWVDRLYQRSYKTPEIRLTMIRAAAPVGPR